MSHEDPYNSSTLYLYSYTKNPKVNKDRLYKLLSFYKEAKMYSSTINSYELFLLFLIARPLDEKFNEANNLRGFPGSFFRFCNRRYDSTIWDAENIYFREGEELLVSYTSTNQPSSFFIYCSQYRFNRSIFYVVKDKSYSTWEQFYSRDKWKMSSWKKTLISRNELKNKKNHIFSFELQNKVITNIEIVKDNTNFELYLKYIEDFAKPIKAFNFYTFGKSREKSEYREEYE